MEPLQFIIARRALHDLDEIWDHLSRQAGADVADGMNDRIMSAIGRLSRVPHIGHTRRDVADPRYLFWVVRPYVIAYRREHDRLRVARVVHGARDFRRIFRSAPPAE
ncbi:MAG: type II toxin-antitoxin system RelE/ParE family toxin [Phycisphaerae bacterium]|nr:type II toxin-antitoxin system RelE/ParE family toxin [Tepidisphaeraceae bacterium]